MVWLWLKEDQGKRCKELLIFNQRLIEFRMVFLILTEMMGLFFKIGRHLVGMVYHFFQRCLWIITTNMLYPLLG